MAVKIAVFGCFGLETVTKSSQSDQASPTHRLTWPDIDPNMKEIVWKSAPEGDVTFGTNTSSPCVADGKVFYGTISGNLHILNARNGDRVKTIAHGWPIMSAITLANDSIYFLTLDGVVHSLCS